VTVVIAIACLLVAAYMFGKQRAMKRVKIENNTPFTIDASVFAEENKIVINSIELPDIEEPKEPRGPELAED
jgi:hypothetical protein